MKARKQFVEAPLTINDFIVCAARGVMLKNGGVKFSGRLFVRDCPVAFFSNEGNGGCNSWTVSAPTLFGDAEEFAKRHLPDLKFEQLDHLVGELWDAAIMRGVK